MVRVDLVVLSVALLASGCSESSVTPRPGTAPYSMSGQILKQGVAVAGVTVNFDGQDAPVAVTTDAQGRYSQDGFKAGTYTIRPVDGVHDFYYGGALTNPLLSGQSATSCL